MIYRHRGSILSNGWVADILAMGAGMAKRAERLAVTALMLLPGALIVFTGVNAGGYFLALASYALMTLVSASWSHSTSRALIEFDRAWFYLLILLLLGSVRPSTQSLRWLVRGLLLGASIVCLAGLIDRKSTR